MSRPSQTRNPRLSTAARRAIQRAVHALTYSVEQLARELRVTPGTLFNYRFGRTRATPGALRRLARVLRRQARLLNRRYRELMRTGR